MFGDVNEAAIERRRKAMIQEQARVAYERRQQQSTLGGGSLTQATYSDLTPADFSDAQYKSDQEEYMKTSMKKFMSRIVKGVFGLGTDDYKKKHGITPTETPLAPQEMVQKQLHAIYQNRG